MRSSRILRLNTCPCFLKQKHRVDSIFQGKKNLKIFTHRMIFKPSMIVVITNGRLAGKKAVVLREIDEHHIFVAGIAHTPVASEDYIPAWQKRRNARFLTFLKKININHVLATRYKADIGLADLKADEAIADIEAKKVANTEVNAIMKNAYDAKKAKWLFTTLKF